MQGLEEAGIHLEWNPQGRRKRERPVQTWRRMHFAEPQATGVSWVAAKKTAQNRTLDGNR